MGRFFAAVNVDGGGLNAPGVSLPGMPPDPDGSPYPYLTTPPADVSGKTLCLNARTVRGGSMWVELLDEALKPVPGYTREDCTPFQGDETCTPVSWKTGSVPTNKAVHTRVYLTTGMLYGLEWR